MNEIEFAVIVPVHNPSRLLFSTLESIDSQLCRPKEIVVVVDGGECPDVVRQMILKRFTSDSRVTVLMNDEAQGLAKAYSLGVRHSRSPIIVFMHQDVVAENTRSACELVGRFHDVDVVAVGHRNLKWKPGSTEGASIALLSFLAATQYKEATGWDGKFDGVRREAFQLVGGFNDQKFRSAGEDGDLIRRLSKVGKIVNSSAGVYHLQTADNFGWVDLFGKRFQYAEASGALRRQKSTSVFRTALAMWREVSLIVAIVGAMISLYQKPLGLIICVLGVLGLTPVPLIVARDSQRPLAFFGLMVVEPIVSACGATGFIRGFISGSARHRGPR